MNNEKYSNELVICKTSLWMLFHLIQRRRRRRWCYLIFFIIDRTSICKAINLVSLMSCIYRTKDNNNISWSDWEWEEWNAGFWFHQFNNATISHLKLAIFIKFPQKILHLNQNTLHCSQPRWQQVGLRIGTDPGRLVLAKALLTPDSRDLEARKCKHFNRTRP